MRVGTEVKQRIPEMAEAFTAELGAPAMISAAFHQNAVDMWDDAATFHERFEFEQERTWKGGHGSIVREPIGVVATIIPWNGPVATASLKISPALAAGCTVVLKPAPEGPVSTMMLADGNSARIAIMASTPFISGICKSISVTSGRCALNCSTASWPFEASATSFKSA